jgi:hypothetical protein
MLVCVIPMALPTLRRRYSYELRKLIHYTSLAMMVSNCC